MYLDENIQHSRLVTTRNTHCSLWPVVLCGNRKKPAETHDDSLIDDKLVNLDEVPQEPIIAGEIIKSPENSNFMNYQRPAEVFIPPEERLLSYSNNQSSDVTIVVNPIPSKIDEVLLMHSAKSISSTPSMSSQCCSSSIEDTDDIFAGPCTFCPLDQPTNTELRVDTTSDYSSEVFATNLGRTPNSSPTISNTSELLNKMITIPPNADERYLYIKFLARCELQVYFFR